MKTLILMRHGKSSWRDESLDDHERPLKRRGIDGSREMASLLLERNLIPGEVWCSDSVRTRQTWEHVARVWQEQRPDLTPRVTYLPELYHASAVELAAIVASHAGPVSRVLVVGHNPGMEDWIAQLTGRDAKFPTAAVCQMDVAIKEWSELTTASSASMVARWRPTRKE